MSTQDRTRQRIMFYVQHLLGIGHVKRASALAAGLHEQGFDVLMVLGGPNVALVDFGPIPIHQLAPARADGAGFDTLLDEHDRPIDDDWRDKRAAGLMRVHDDFAPDIILIEMFPFGRRQFRFELIPLLDAVQERALVLCSLRDVLVARAEPRKNQWMVDTAKRYFDGVLVHGDPAVLPLQDSFPLAHQIKDLLHYTGYVVAEDRPNEKVEDRPNEKAEDRPNEKVEDRPDGKAEDRPNEKAEDRPNEKAEDRPNEKVEDRPDGKAEDRPDRKADEAAAGVATGRSGQGQGQEPSRGEIIVSIGGGAVGETLLRCALGAAADPQLAKHHWRLLAGENLRPAIFEDLKRQAPGHVTVERARPDFRALLRCAALSISQGGYNTVMDILSANCKNVIIPFATGAESEQTQRTQAFEQRGLLTMLEETKLSPHTLARSCLSALNGPPPRRAALDLTGVRTSAKLIQNLAHRKKDARA